MENEKGGKPTKTEEEIKYLRLHIEQMIKENVALKKQLEDQVENSKQTKRMLNEYIGNVTTQEELLSKMKTTTGNLEALTKSQEETIKEIQAEIAKLTNLADKKEILLKENKKFEPCLTCNRTVPETTKEMFMAKQERLLKEIERSREELASYLKQLEDLEGIQDNKDMRDHEAVQQIFNIQNLGMMQELLEQAEESDEVLLFTDHKKNTWQIINRNDINVGPDFNVKLDAEVYDVNEEEEERVKPMIRNKNLVIDVEGIENEHNMENGDEKEERVSIIEDVDPVSANTEDKKEEELVR